MKKFIYFEDTEGGIDLHIINSPSQLQVLRGWMSPETEEDDTNLAEFVGIAEVGEVYMHRLGYLVRVKED